MITVTIQCATVEELYSYLRPQDVIAAQPKAASKAQKSAAADAVINAAKDSTQPEPAAPVKDGPIAKATPGVWSDPDARPTIEQLRAAVKAKSEAGHRAALKTLLTEYGVANVSSLAPELYADFLAKVNEL
jgi:hypothetical protein